MAAWDVEPDGVAAVVAAARAVGTELAAVAQPDGEYESWQVTGPAGLRMVANTEGALVVWS